MIPIKVSLIFPMFAMLVLTNIVLFKMFLTRKKAVLSGQTPLSYYKTFNQGIEAPAAHQAARHYTNLFEAPVLFYVVCILGLILPIQSLGFLVLAWLYVIVRYAHAYIHVGENKIGPRMKAFGFSWILLIAMWIWILVKALAITSS